MPLSLLAKDEIAQAAGSLHVSLSMVPSAALHNGPKRLRRALVATGATVHFPSVVLFDGSEPRSNAIAGYKRARAYRTLLRPRLVELASGAPAPAPAPIGAVASNGLTDGSDDGAPYEEQTPEIRVVWRQQLPRPPGAFFRRVPGTRYITFELRGTVYLQHLDTDERFVAPGFVDFIPTPDGALFVTPGKEESGLEFYVASGVLERGRAGEGEHVTPVFVDIQMADQYPSVGILETQPGRRTTYRILVSWFEGLAIRDYEVTWVGSASVRVTPRSPKLEACRGWALSTPMLSKDGREIAARDETTGTTKIFRLARNGSCQLVYDIGRQTSKVAFSDDGTLIAYSSPNARANARSTTYVLNRRTRQTLQIPESESLGLVIPEMIGPDSLLLQATQDSRRRSVEFRLLCCVR